MSNPRALRGQIRCTNGRWRVTRKCWARAPVYTSSVNNLALYQSQGRYGDAEPLYQRALAAREKVLGPEHPDTLSSVNNLAGLYQSQGRYGEAEPLYQRVLAGLRRCWARSIPIPDQRQQPRVFISIPRAVRGSGTAVPAGAGGARELGRSIQMP
ncbi:MAG: tetratricopeptide repeat protein [Candidatus Competibacteraceae bacterium]